MNDNLTKILNTLFKQDININDNLIEKLNTLSEQKFITLRETNKKFNGLCEIICNFILTKDLLGKKTNFKESITIEDLNQSVAKKMHIAENNSYIAMIIYHITSYYPGNKLKIFEQKRLNKKQKHPILTNSSSFDVNIIKTALGKIKENQYVKLIGLTEQFKGHSMLIKKLENEKFAYYDPNNGEEILDLNSLANKILSLSYNKLIFLDGERFLNKYCIKNQIKHKIIKCKILFATMLAGSGLALLHYKNLTNIGYGLEIAAAVTILALFIFSICYKPKFDHNPDDNDSISTQNNPINSTETEQKCHLIPPAQTHNQKPRPNESCTPLANQ